MDNSMDKKRIEVAAGIVRRHDKIFLTKRSVDAHQGGKWEFPGGKVEAGETAIAALGRELAEEIGIKVTHADEFIKLTHEYPEKIVTLTFFTVDGFDGEPQGLEGQGYDWFETGQLAQLTFPEANIPVLDKLLLQYGC